MLTLALLVGVPWDRAYSGMKSISVCRYWYHLYSQDTKYNQAWRWVREDQPIFVGRWPAHLPKKEIGIFSTITARTVIRLTHWRQAARYCPLQNLSSSCLQGKSSRPFFLSSSTKWSRTMSEPIYIHCINIFICSKQLKKQKRTRSFHICRDILDSLLRNSLRSFSRSFCGRVQSCTAESTTAIVNAGGGIIRAFLSGAFSGVGTSTLAESCSHICFWHQNISRY